MNYKKYPIFLNLENKNILIVGGGNACLEKLYGLEFTGANLQVISTEFSDEVKTFLNKYPNISIEKRAVREEDLNFRDIIFLATSDSETNLYFRKIAKEKGIWVNSVDDPKNCDFYSSSSVFIGPIQFAISTDGKFAGVSSTLRKLFEEILPEEDYEFMETIFEMRRNLKEILPDQKERRLALKEIIQNLNSKYFHKSN
ncbi:bifunctional precorrin-2 dehydrogenase/sirohydrochlorin ferrochelatase [Leptospira sp. 2 VSF19]|uniref:precorrin-2 dehydrogenase n=1 Tax=Leptospira soteropolitanensis TaxID=2950025 RepID=A0AAW5VT45_9LEPT|nr:bifunctional precorrin-2 dehydrogenase/sirohydrochlorin ferrochelatase [Leptospira soteropolitanensis]MCW7494503.1 bifunctional precorrin-2 dehydrogenase/sirohydrochlorin ferrochelatase [Leptospira soteropolitanensis]MCW7502097.1 bifunctional precorrin-2 dehydrogenase/sirohydrochlorin ferrochelatase [Leptospira soteropolitanensis]MCW7524349.1 bifunctional precorrin-2 dehydrogenase/sirohydrochlorin ferrochelatase [Leptospira soteropolitanensis]MCW7528215.1 bifunctional precorrin-2 dehydrogena